MNRTYTKLPFLLLPVLCLSSLAGHASAQTYKEIGDYKLSSGQANAVAVDSDARRVYVATAGGISVLNADTGAVVGTVAGISSAHDVLIVPEMKGDEKAPPAKAFATDGNGHVMAFSLADMKASAPIKLPTGGPASMCYDSDAKTVEVVSPGGSLTTIDASDNKVVKAGKIATGAGQIVCGTLAHVYVADPAANTVHVLNHDTMQNDGDFPMKSGKGPSGLALDTKGRRLFVGCEDGTIEVVDTDAGFTFIELKGGTGPSRETFVWLPQGKGQWKAAAFVAQQDGTLSGVRMNAYINYSLAGTYKLEPGLGSIAFDEKTHHLLIASNRAGTPQVVVVGY